jgi:16S rRNA (guanine527-N7)-methyltransferase
MTSRVPLPPHPPRDPLPESLDDVPPFPASARAILADGIRVLGLDATLDAGARAALEGHARLLLAWTEHVNLTGIREPDAVAREHLLDSLAGVTVLAEIEAPTVIDLGSGGGFPGIPLAIALPAARIRLVESIGKKARFLGVAVRELGLASRVEVDHVRAEALERAGVAVDAVCVRAVADLGRLAALSAPLLVPGGRLIAWKRGDVHAEIEAAGPALRAAGFDPPAVRDVPVAGLEDHRLVVATFGAPSASRPEPLLGSPPMSSRPTAG